MTALDLAVPTPRRVELNYVDVAATPEQAWSALRHADFGQRSALVRALFALRTLASGEPTTLRIDDLVSSADKPGFQVLHEAPHEVVVGAIGQVWKLRIPFVHVHGLADYAAFAQPGFVKVAWALRVLPRGADAARIEFEVRIDATDDDSWRKFAAYFAWIGIGSHFIRRILLASFARELGNADAEENERALPGDELLSDARAELTHGITICARPEAIWPWLVQLGCDRAGFYSVDLLDNHGRPSARELHPELANVQLGDVLPARPGSEDGFEVLRIEPNRALVLGGLWDPLLGRQLPFSAARPEHFWHITWAFVLEALDAKTTRVHVRARAAFPESGAFHAGWIRAVHAFMERAQLRGLKARAEGSLPRDDVRDVMAGIGGGLSMLFALMTPFLRRARSHWGLDEAAALRAYPADDLVPTPNYSFTHAVEIEASAACVWPWIAQIGAERAGFYSYQWLENIAGCELRNAETIHPEWELKLGDEVHLHPHVPALRVHALEKGRWFVVYGAPDAEACARNERWVSASWLFFIEPIAERRCRLISRYRASSSPDLATRLAFGPRLVEPIGFAMDRRMLRQVKALAERRAPVLRNVNTARANAGAR